MPSKKKKYNARFPAGRIKKIMQTDEEVGKVAQAVPIIISRTLELFVESLLSKAMQVTMARNAKTLSPSHVKQCILAESRFDFLRDLVKNIPDVSAAEEKEMMSAESSPNSSRFSDMSVPPRRVLREDSNSSSSCDVKLPPPGPPAPAPLSREHLKRGLSTDPDIPHKLPRESMNDDPYPAYVPKEPTCTVTSATAIDLSKKEEVRANFYHDTLEDVPLRSGSVITVNPTYSSPQPSTSYTNLTRVPPVQKIDIPPPKVNFERHNSLPRTPVTPIINIDFSKNLSIPEIKVLDPTNISVPKNDKKTLSRQNSKSKIEVRKIEIKPVTPQPPPVAPPIDIDRLNSGNLQIDEDYDT